MRRLIILAVLIIGLTSRVYGLEFTAPQVPDSGKQYMPADTESFADGLWFVIKTATAKMRPSIMDASKVCISLIAAVILISFLKSYSGTIQRTVELVAAILISVVLLEPANTLIGLGVSTVQELSEYGKLFLPVMTAALAAQGGATTSAALYTGTALFNSILSTLISKLIVPTIYIYLCICIANSALNNELLNNFKKFTKWLMTWILKIVLYVFTGYLGITGVVSGTADASAVKAAKLAISGFVPVVGSIISDASETILISAGLMKSAVGIYGLLAFIAIWIGPFIQIGAQYVMLKITASVCSLFGTKQTTELLHDFSAAMGLLLAMTGTVCLFLMISTVCFMRGVT